MFDYQFWIPLSISIASAVFAYRANRYTHRQAKESFKNLLRDGLKNAKYKIIELDEKEYNIHEEKMLIIESITDNLMYLSYNEEKKIYLSDLQRQKLSKLQEDVEEYLGLIMMNIPPQKSRQLPVFFNSIRIMLPFAAPTLLSCWN